MTELDRRTIITGLAAVAVTGLALPIRAAPSPVLRFAFNWRPCYDHLPLDYEAEIACALLNSAWLYDGGRFFGRWSIRHVASGLTFCQAEPETPAAWAIELDHIDTRADLAPTSYDAIHLIGYSALQVIIALRLLEAADYELRLATDAMLIRYPWWELPDPFEIPYPLSFEDAELLRPVPINRVLTMPHVS
jgi:hypothetical protein